MKQKSSSESAGESAVVPIRQAQKEFTRRRILDAARDLFHENHYNMTTMDDIAKASGLRRPTIYLHFRDKSQIFGELAAEYVPRARAMMAKLKGPSPTVADIESWIEDVIDFVEAEKVSISVIVEISFQTPGLFSLRQIFLDIITGFSENIPAFRSVVGKETPNLASRARAELLITELTWACRFFSLGDDPQYAREMIKGVAENFRSYIVQYG